MKHIQIRNSDMAWHIAANIQFPPNFGSSIQYVDYGVRSLLLMRGYDG